MDPRLDSIGSQPPAADTAASAMPSQRPNLADPSVVLSLLEADQVVAAKQHTRFGSRKLSPGLRALLWSLRVYVVVMIVIVVISVVRAAHGTP